MSSKHTQFFMAFFLATIAATHFGLGYASGNQNTYLIEGFSKIDPGLLTNDWFTHQSKHHHANFCNIILFIHYLGLPMGVTLVSLEVLLRIIALVSIYKIIELLSQKYALAIFALLLAFFVLEETVSVCESYIFGEVLQPSSFGSTFTIVGLLYFLRSSYFASGLAMAFAGYMHTNFLLLGFVYLGLAHIFLGPKQFIKRTLLQFTPMLVVFSMTLPYLLQFMSSENSKLARDIIIFIRAPHHYFPQKDLVDFIAFLGWSILGGWSLITTYRENSLPKRFTAVYLSILIVIFLATLLTTVVFIPTISQLFFWRMAPFCVMFSQILFFNILVQRVYNSKNISFKQCAVELVFALVLVYLTKKYRYWLAMLPLAGALFFLLRPSFVKISTSKLFPQKHKLAFLSLAATMFLLVVVSYKSNVFYQKSTFINDFPPKRETELYKWCSTTEETSIFLIPPDLENFRLHAKRAIVVDWKSLSVHPDDVVEWYSRIQDICGVKNVASLIAANEGYSQLTLPQLNNLVQKYNIDYIVFYREHNKHALPIVFENETFCVVKLAK